MLVPVVLEAFSLNVVICVVDKIILVHPLCCVISQVMALGFLLHILRPYQEDGYGCLSFFSSVSCHIGFCIVILTHYPVQSSPLFLLTLDFVIPVTGSSMLL